MPRNVIPEPLYAPAINALREQGVRGAVAATAYLKWQKSAPAETCKYGKEQGIALDCVCVGCIEALCFLYFDQVQQKFAIPPM